MCSGPSLAGQKIIVVVLNAMRIGVVDGKGRVIFVSDTKDSKRKSTFPVRDFG